MDRKEEFKEDLIRAFDEILSYPIYDPKRWATRKEWFEDIYSWGFYWITDIYDENGELRSK